MYTSTKTIIFPTSVERMSNKKKVRIAQIFILLVLFSSEANAEEPKTITWENLVPKHVALKNPLQELELQVRLNIEYIAVTRFQERTGQISMVDPDYEFALELEQELKLKNIDFEPLIKDFDKFLDAIEVRNRTIVTKLDGKLVRIPGYALPLESTATSITEFLLVPTVGACIHTPVPPANQMIYVKVNDTYTIHKLYEPIWVIGHIEIEHINTAINYSDGDGDVESAYVIKNAKIQAYQD